MSSKIPNALLEKDEKDIIMNAQIVGLGRRWRLGFLLVLMITQTNKTRVDVKRHKFMEQMNERDRETDLAKHCDRWFDGCS